MKRPRPENEGKLSNEEMRLIEELSRILVHGERGVVFITGAGISTSAGIPAFRTGDDAVWSTSITENGKRKALRKDVLGWYNNFWIPIFEAKKFREAKPTEAHLALARIAHVLPKTRVVTQNVDGLHCASLHGDSLGIKDDQLVEAHGRISLFRCSGFSPDGKPLDSACTPDQAFNNWYEMNQLLPEDASAFLAASESTSEKKRKLLKRVPRCPQCKNASAIPMALLFDEMYDTHLFFESDAWDSWYDQTDAIVFIGTSFSVQLTSEAMKRSKKLKIPLFNINLTPPPTNLPKLYKRSITAPSDLVLPTLAELVQQLLLHHPPPAVLLTATTTTSTSSAIKK